LPQPVNETKPAATRATIADDRTRDRAKRDMVVLDA